MKPAWDKLGGEYEGSSSVLIADVDCTVEQELCSSKGVQGYPTIKYYVDGDTEGKSYNGGRSYEDLKKFTEDTLEVACLVDAPEGCTEKEVGFIEKMKAKDQAYYSAQITRLTGMKGKKMTAPLKAWLLARLNILQQLSSGNKDEL